MTLNTIAQTLLPKPLYQRLAASSIAKRLARGSLWSLFGSASSRILVLVSMILVARVLGQESFGELGLIQATLGVAGMMAGFGLGATATRFVAQHAVTDPDRAGRVIALVMQITWITVFLAAGILVLASGPLAIRVLEAPQLKTALSWGVLLMAANVLRGIQSGIFAAVERFDLIAKLNLLEGMVSLLAMVVLAHYLGVQGALLGLAAAALAAWIIGRLMLGEILRSRGIVVRWRGCWADWQILHGFALPSFLANLVATPVLWFCMTLLARQPNGYAELGLYNAAYQWHGPMIFIPMIVMSVSIPVLVQEWEAGEVQRFRKVTLWICALTLLIALPPAALVAALSPWVLDLYGSGFRDGWLIMVLILAAAPLHGLSKIASGALLGMNKAWLVLFVNLLWGATLMALAVWLTPVWGALGLATAFLAAYSVLATGSIIMVLLGSDRRRGIQIPHRFINQEEAA